MKKTILFVAIFVCTAMTIAAQSRLHDLDIRVVLSKNGDAHITETRQMTITSEGTECYIVHGNTGQSVVKDLTVSDEQGRQFEKVLYWDVDWDRDEKTGKCGIVEKRPGYELCWGLGAEGERTYTASYTVTGMVEGYSESDGFNWMFVARDIKPYPEHVKLTITAEDGTLLTDTIANIWAFGYGGNINFTDSGIVAETTEPFKEHDAMIVMCEFSKGIYNPGVTYNKSFETVKKDAFEGSDYLSEEKDEEKREKKEEWWKEPLKWICGIGLIFLVLGGLLGGPVTRLVHKFKYKRNIDWYRDIPLGGDLKTANLLLNKLNDTCRQDDKLLSALLLKLVQTGALGIQSGPGKPSFVIKSWEADAQMPNGELLQNVYDIFKSAAGDDQVLDPKELTRFMEDEKNHSAVYHFLYILDKGYISKLSDYKTEVRQLLGLKKYLKEFTLINERDMQEVTLWKDYMVWATLFGCASKVVKQMKKINPEYFKMDDIASQLAYSATVPEVTKVFTTATHSAYSKYMSSSYSDSSDSSRSSGGGGYASRGGGGGYRGGGSGGGIR